MLKDFPAELQLIDWNYSADCTFENTLSLMQGEHKVLGASGIGVSGEAGALLYSPFNHRQSNISRWLEFAETHHIGVIHTIWGRDTSLGRPYANWYAAAAGCIAAGDPEKWEAHPWKNLLNAASEAIAGNSWDKLAVFAERIRQLPAANEIERAALEYYALSMHYQYLRQGIYQQRFIRRWQEKARKYTGLDECSYASTCRYFYQLVRELKQWKKDFCRFYRQYKLSDLAEVMDLNFTLLEEDLNEEIKIVHANGM